MVTHPGSALPFHARVVFIDLANTLIFARKQTELGSETTQFFIILANILAKQEGIPVSRARQRVLKISENQPLDLEAYTSKLGIDPDEARTAYLHWMSSVWSTDSDVEPALLQFRKKGLKLWPATTNAGFLFAMKLQAVGLSGSLFEELCGGNEVHSLGKSTSIFFKTLLKRAGIPPEEAVHIGSTHLWDFDLSFNAGIRQVILLDRNLPERYVQGENGEIYARSWSVIRHLVFPIGERD